MSKNADNRAFLDASHFFRLSNNDARWILFHPEYGAYTHFDVKFAISHVLSLRYEGILVIESSNEDEYWIEFADGKVGKSSRVLPVNTKLAAGFNSVIGL